MEQFGFNQTIDLSADGYSSIIPIGHSNNVSLQLSIDSNTTNGSFTLQGSNDKTHWVTIQITDVSTGTSSSSIPATSGSDLNAIFNLIDLNVGFLRFFWNLTGSSSQTASLFVTTKRGS